MRTYQQDHNRAMYGQALKQAREAFAAGLMTSPAWIEQALRNIGPQAREAIAKAIAHNSGRVGSEAAEALSEWLTAYAKSETMISPEDLGEETPPPSTRDITVHINATIAGKVECMAVYVLAATDHDNAIFQARERWLQYIANPCIHEYIRQAPFTLELVG